MIVEYIYSCVDAVILLIELGLFVTIIEAIALPLELLGFARLIRSVIYWFFEAIIVPIELGLFVAIIEVITLPTELLGFARLIRCICSGC